MSSSVESVSNLLFLQKYAKSNTHVASDANVCELGGGEDTHHYRETFDVSAFESINPNAAQLLATTARLVEATSNIHVL